MTHNLIRFSVLGILIFDCCGCHKRETTPIVISSEVERDLAQNGMFQSGWFVDINDGDVDEWPASLLADASNAFNSQVEHMFPITEYPKPQGRIIPELSGYEVLVLCHERLSGSQNDRVLHAADDAVGKAHRHWLEKIHSKRPK